VTVNEVDIKQVAKRLLSDEKTVQQLIKSVPAGFENNRSTVEGLMALLSAISLKEADDFNRLNDRITGLSDSVIRLWMIATRNSEEIGILAAGVSTLATKRIEAMVPANKSETVHRPLAFKVTLQGGDNSANFMHTTLALDNRVFFYEELWRYRDGTTFEYDFLQTPFARDNFGKAQTPEFYEPGYMFPTDYYNRPEDAWSTSRSRWDYNLGFTKGAWTEPDQANSAELLTEIWSVPASGKFPCHYGTVDVWNVDTFTWTDTLEEVSVPFTMQNPGFGDEGPALNESYTKLQKRAWNDVSFAGTAKTAMFYDLLHGVIKNKGKVQIAKTLSTLIKSAAYYALPETFIIDMAADFIGNYVQNTINGEIKQVNEELFGVKEGPTRSWIRRIVESSGETDNINNEPYGAMVWQITKTTTRPNQLGATWPDGNAQNSLMFSGQTRINWPKYQWMIDIMAVSHLPLSDTVSSLCEVDISVDLTKPDGTVWLTETSAGTYEPILVRWAGAFYAVEKLAGPVWKAIDYP
jgi:hypothetical protein